MERGRSGRVLLLDIASRRVQTIASKLQYAFGACAAGDEFLVSESWRHRLIAIAADGTQRAVFDNLPVYPSRLSTAASGGFWLTAFAARTQLVEFVLRENAYRRRMMAEIDPEYWIAPKLKSGQSFLEPMQGAHIKTMGVIKPWAPPRSYGLVIRLSARRRAALRAAQPGRWRQPRRGRGDRDGWRAVRPRQGARPPAAHAADHDREGIAHMSDTILALSKATKLYAGVPAIEGVDFELRRGEIHALVGENGAGKSTLTKVMAGVVTLTSGTMQVNGVEVAPKTPLEARHLGIAMVFQENSLVPTMTVAQNLFLGQERFYNRLRGIYIAAQQFLQSLNFDVTPTATVGPARRRQEADGRNRARRAARGESHHLRRADCHADAGRKEVFLRPGARPQARAACRSCSSPMRWRKR